MRNSRRSRTCAALVRCGFAVAVVSVLCLPPPAARADVAASGSWALTLTGTPSTTADAVFAQQGTTLNAMVSFNAGDRNPFMGSVDPATGAFTVGGVLVIFTSPPVSHVFALSGSVAADGTLTGSLACADGGCNIPPWSVTGTLLSALCGNGSVDAGEACDPGTPPASEVCCGLRCAALPAGTACEADTAICTHDACDGAGVCTHAPGNAGVTCRPKGPPCDVAEVCDGVSATCPPDQPTCPPADIDVTGTWRITSDVCFCTVDTTFVQDGTSLLVGTTAGWLDPATRAFQALATFGCPTLGGTATSGLTGTFSADGESLVGTEYDGVEKVTPPAGCFTFTGTASGVRIATSPSCGNGILDAGEECDSSVTGSGCCYSDCHLKPAGAICRPAANACDVPETCDGVAATCPPDGIPDACDPCTGGPGAERPRLQASAAKLLVRGRAALAAGASIDPVSHGLRLLVADGVGATFLDVTVPGGAVAAGTGWKVGKHGWNFVATSPVGGAVTAVTLRVKNETRVDFKVSGKHDTLPPLPTSLPIRATLVLDPPQSATGLCTDATFPGPKGVAPVCTLKQEGRQLVCR
jgi:hypothetical protein